MKHTRILFSLALFLLFIYNGQSQVQLNIPNETVSNGDQITLPVTVTNFDNLLVLQCALRFDTTLLDFAHFTTNTDVGYMDTTLVNYDADESAIRLAWQTGDFTNGTTASDGSVLFEAVFNVIGEPCDSTYFTLHEFGFFMTQVVNVSGENLTLAVNDGLVKIPGEDCGPGPNDFILDIGDVSANQGQKICVPIIISGIDSVNGIQFSLSWDPALLTYDSWQNSALPSAQFNDIPATTDQGKWSVLWTAPNLETGMTFPNGSAIIEVCFFATGAPGNVVPITFSNSPTPQEFADVGGQVFPGLVPGSVTITGDPVDPVHVNIGSGNANQNSLWCVEITTAGFVDMIAIQGSFVFDSEVLDYDSFITASLPGVTGITLVPDPDEPNVVGFLWTDNAVQGVTLNDGDVMFLLCFNVIGECNETSSIEFLGEPVEIVASNLDGVVPVETSSGTFTVNCAPTIGLVPHDQSCADVCDGYLTLTYSGLEHPVDINWSSTDTFNLCAGQYSVTLTDANSVELSASANIGTPPPIVITGASSGNFETGNGVIDITVSGGTPGYTYEWDTDPVQTTEDAAGLSYGTYYVTVTDDNDCEEVFGPTTITPGDFEINIDLTPKGQFDISCFDECDGQVEISAFNATFPLSVLWSDGNTDLDRDDLCAGEYCVTVTDAESNSIDTCFTLVGPGELLLAFDIDCSSGAADGSATAVVSGGAGNYTYLWNDGEQSTTAHIENLLPNIYIAVVTDDNGCQISGAVNLDCSPPENCYDWREIITPNGDGLNENLVITCADETDNELSIFNRWGQLVYKTENYSNDWIGEDLDGNPVPDDTYMFVLQVKTGTETEIYKGAVSVFRKFN